MFTNEARRKSKGSQCSGVHSGGMGKPTERLEVRYLPLMGQQCGRGRSICVVVLPLSLIGVLQTFCFLRPSLTHPPSVCPRQKTTCALCDS